MAVQQAAGGKAPASSVHGCPARGGEAETQARSPVASSRARGRRSAAVPSAREALRRRTHATHAKLHDIAAFAALSRGELTLADYTRLLVRLANLHGELETKLAIHDRHAAFAWRVAAPGGSPAQRLRADLAVLGMSAGQFAAIPRCEGRLPALEAVDSALGAAWVVEGSAFGGAVISRWLQDGLGVGPANGGAFFAAPPGQAERWRRCCEAIETRGADPGGRALMLAAADETFAAFASGLGNGA
jgi:heme oxygenase